VLLFDAHLLTAVPLGFSESVLPLEEQLNPSDSSRSRCRYNIYLGLHSYVRHGARSGLEIAVDYHDGGVPFSTLPAIYRGHHHSLLSVWFVRYLLTLNPFFPSSNGGEFDEECVLEFMLQQWRFVPLIHWHEVEGNSFVGQYWRALDLLHLRVINFRFLVSSCID